MSKNSEFTEQSSSSRGERRRARTRIELLAAARKIFAERGYHEASIAEITALADVGVGTFYLHFRDKDDAFCTLLDEGFQHMQEEIIADVQAARGPLLQRVVRAVFRHAYNRRDLFQIALTARGQLARTRVFRFQERLAEGLAKALEIAQAAGELEHYNLAVTARLITGMITQGVFWWFENEEPGPEVMAEQVLLLLRQGLPELLFHIGEDDAQKG